jgi:DNA-binding transcriptional MerR regulator
MFQIGDFSKLCQVSKRLLHHYDERGLLSPIFVDPHSGYRFYSAKQIPLLNRILALKELGLSLDQISQLVQEGVSDEQIKGMLSLKEAELRQSLSIQQMQIQKIRTRMLLNDAENTVPDVIMKAIPETHYLGTRNHYGSPEALMIAAQEIMSQLGKLLAKQKDVRFTACVFSETFDMNAQDVQLGFSLAQKPSSALLAPLRSVSPEQNNPLKLEAQTLPEIKEAACAILVGAEDAILMGMNHIARWLEETGYEMNGPYREVIIEWPDSGNFTEAVIEIQLPVIRRKT